VTAKVAWTVALLLPLTAVRAGLGSPPDAPPPAIPGKGVVLPPVGVFGRTPIPRDAVAVQIATGKWAAPKAGDAVTGTDGARRTWAEVEAGKDGAFNAPGGGYVYLAVPAEREQVLILEANGHALVYVNGEPRTGDLYGHGYVRLPVLLHKGTNDLLFQVGRGAPRAKLVEPKAAAVLHTGDNTLPNLLVGQKPQYWAATVVLNCTSDTLEGLELSAALPDGAAVVTPLPPLPPLSLRKVPFRVEGPAPTAEGNVDLQIQLLRKNGGKSDTLDQGKLVLDVRLPEKMHARTFRSAIDGSVQYFALVPAKSDGKTKPGLTLTLHGAAVEATGQAACYAPKTWTHVVAPTNRRPFGFDWEDWGRLDAMEVLDLAAKELDTDRSRTCLTGHSMGGHGTWHLGVTYPDRFAAIAPSAGWVSMWSYAGARRPENPNPLQEIFLRAASPSDTLALARNTLHDGVYVLHGDKDDNVPVEQARKMREVLGGFHPDFAYHEQPGAGHWWGNACVDWPPLFEFLKEHTLPDDKDVREVEFVTVSPGVSARSHWLTIEAQEKAFQPSSAHLRFDPQQTRFSGTTENVTRLSLDLEHPAVAGKPPEFVQVELDGQKLDKIPWPAKGPAKVWLERQEKRWTAGTEPAASLKGPQRYGPFREAFRNRMQFVYGTKGTAAENGWALAKARYDAEAFWYRGNGSIDVLPDTKFDPKAEPDRNVILYGNAETNAAWKPLLGDSPLQVRGGVVAVGEREEKGDELAVVFVRPRPGSDRALVGVVGGSGVVGMRLTERLPYFVSGVGYPDWLVFGPEAMAQGSAGVRGAGFFGIDWSVKMGEAVWHK
jgi:poly(3-hydroxybutyrate) depolymerase